MILKNRIIETLTNSIVEVLKNYQNEPLDGFFMVKISVRKEPQPLTGIKWKALRNGLQSAIIQEPILNDLNLELILIKSDGKTQNEYPISEIIQPPVCSKCFDQEELSEYLKVSGDKNSIHFGPNPVVPGLLILQFIFQKIDNNKKEFTIKYFKPLVLQNELNIFQISDNQFIGICANIKIFEMITF